jgi:hypothetical protein
MAERVASWAKGAKSKRTTSRPEQRIAKVHSELLRIIEVGDFGRAKASHMVELYALLHEKVYGVAPDELASTLVRQSAGRMAQTMLGKYFGGDAERMILFMRWCWRREESLAQWRRKKKIPNFRRLVWRKQFGVELVTEYKIEIASKAGRV